MNEYKGFLHLQCKQCGATHTFCAKTPMHAYRCKACGTVTVLEKLDRAEQICECGNRSSYHTNVQDEVFDINCVRCGSPVAMAWHSGYRRYMPCDLEEPERKKKRRHRR